VIFKLNTQNVNLAGKFFVLAQLYGAIVRNGLVGGKKMGLDSNDSLPKGMDAREAYRKVFHWFKAHKVPRKYFTRTDETDDYGKKSQKYIDNLPEPEKVTNEQILEVMEEILTSRLEWAYHKSDGKYKMAAYAHVVMDEYKKGCGKDSEVVIK